MRVGIIGCGAICSVIMSSVCRGDVEVELVALMDTSPEKCEKLLKNCVTQRSTAICKDIDCVLEARPQLVIEAASQRAVRDCVPKLLARGVDVMVLSVGALLDEELYRGVVEAAKSSNAKVYIPSGAIAGIDAVKALAPLGIERVELRIYKNVKAFDPNTLKRLGFAEIRERTKVFEGSGVDASRLFPANVNVVATLALASGKIPWVELYADPTLTKNIHEIEVEGPASRIQIRVENEPHPENPKTSYLAPLSAIELLKELTKSTNILVGT